MFWAQGYKGHHIHGKVEGNHEEIEVLLNDRDGPGFTRRDVKSYRAAKAMITRHVNRKGLTLCELIRSTAWRMRECEVDVDEFHDTVSIGSNCFMQGDEAADFIEQARKLYDEAQHVSMADCYACLAEPYAENTEN